MESHIPLFAREGEVQRSTGEHRIKPIKRKVRELLGYPYPQRIPKGIADWAAFQQKLGDRPDAEEMEQGVADGCSPWACRGTDLSRDDLGLAT